MRPPRHVLERTSPKGEGQQFVGTCIRCGCQGLGERAVFEECDNVSGMTYEEALRNVLVRALSSDGESG